MPVTAVINVILLLLLMLSEAHRAAADRRHGVPENLVLVAEYVIMHIVLLRRLSGQHERLNEATKRTTIVRQLTYYLY